MKDEEDSSLDKSVGQKSTSPQRTQADSLKQKKFTITYEPISKTSVQREMSKVFPTAKCYFRHHDEYNSPNQ